jgi:DNA helicase-2/ATP-dependent DNA helicase PcrA
VPNVAAASLKLNKAQRQAVDHDLGPMLVLAGAGSGKTGVVTQRIAALLRGGVAARSILAVTFTNKAAGEMLERVVRLVGKKAQKGLSVCTFHRFGLEVLGREGRALGLRGGRFAVYDRGDSLAVLRDALRMSNSGRNYDLGAVMNRISLAKNAFIDPEAYAASTADSDDAYDEITALAYPRYVAALQSMQAYDFDDLVCEPVLLWRRRPDVLERWRMRFRYLIVDEYQDTNPAQLEMVRLIGAEHRNVVVVGDDDQAIYAWRGADVRNILEFDRHFPGAKVVRLERNYRSSEAVLAVANAVLSGSTARRHEKRLVATRGAGDRVKLIVAADGTAEARFVADETHRLVESGDLRPRDIAVLYRSNLQAAEIETELRARGMPYQLFGGTNTFERKEVKDLLGYLRVALDDRDELAILRSINYPPRGIGEAGLKTMAAHATAHDLPLFAVVERPHAVLGLSDTAREGCRAYARIIAELRQRIAKPPPVAEEALRWLTQELGLKEQIAGECGQNLKAAARRWNNVELLLRTFARRDEKAPMAKDALLSFVRLLMLRESDADDGEASDKITLVTMHGAKGLEFRCVFVVGVEEGFLPHTRSLEERATDAPPMGRCVAGGGADGRESDEIEQERRLFYVAVTRARDRLYLCRARRRPARGKMMARTPSRFLVAIPEELFELRELDEVPDVDARVVHRGAEDVLAAIRRAAGGG